MQDHPLPEMLRLSLQDLALRIKILKIKIGSSIEDVLSRALDPPLSLNIQRGGFFIALSNNPKRLTCSLSLSLPLAISSLVEVKALTSNEDITPMGRLLSKLPMDVHLGESCFIFTSVAQGLTCILFFTLGKFLLTAALFKCLDPALTIAATLNSKSPFVAPFGLEQEADRAKLSFKIGSFCLSLSSPIFPSFC